jgi:hypothetical protein
MPLTTGNLDKITNDFHRLIYPQAIAMGYAHLDAFRGDSVRAISYNEIRTLKRNKQMTWDEILTLGSWDALVKKW